jgi:hypothetical protein
MHQGLTYDVYSNGVMDFALVLHPYMLRMHTTQQHGVSYTSLSPFLQGVMHKSC